MTMPVDNSVQLLPGRAVGGSLPIPPLPRRGRAPPPTPGRSGSRPLSLAHSPPPRQVGVWVVVSAALPRAPTRSTTPGRASLPRPASPPPGPGSWGQPMTREAAPLQIWTIRSNVYFSRPRFIGSARITSTVEIHISQPYICRPTASQSPESESSI
jgi:hypothetical protein